MNSGKTALLILIFGLILFSCKNNSTTPAVDDLTKPPKAPANLLLSPNRQTVTATWTASAYTTRYTLFYMEGTTFKKETATKVIGAESPYLVENLTYGKTYVFAVTAENGSGESPLSDIKTVTIASPIVGKWVGTTDTISNNYLNVEFNLNYNSTIVTGTSIITISINGTKSTITPDVSGTFVENALDLVTTGNAISYHGTLSVSNSWILGTLTSGAIPYKLNLQKKQ